MLSDSSDYSAFPDILNGNLNLLGDNRYLRRHDIDISSDDSSDSSVETLPDISNHEGSYLGLGVGS